MIALNPIFCLDLLKTSLFVKRGARLGAPRQLLLPAASAPLMLQIVVTLANCSVQSVEVLLVTSACEKNTQNKPGQYFGQVESSTEREEVISPQA